MSMNGWNTKYVFIKEGAMKREQSTPSFTRGHRHVQRHMFDFAAFYAGRHSSKTPKGFVRDNEAEKKERNWADAINSQVILTGKQRGVKMTE